MSIEIVTGFSGRDHITPSQWGLLNAGIVGPGQYALSTGNKLKATMQTANKVRIDTGDIIMQGRHITCPAYTDLAVDSGVSGQKRNDLVVCRYERESGSEADKGVETAVLKVVKGTPTTGTPADPAIVKGDLFAHAYVNEMPLYRLSLNGLTVATPVPLFDVLTPAKEAWDSVAHEAGWVVERHPSGWARACGTADVAVPCNDVWGSVYQSALQSAPAYPPGLFTERPMCTTVLESDSRGNYMAGAWVTPAYRGTKDKPGDYYVNMPRATGSYVAGGTVVFEAWGRWR